MEVTYEKILEHYVLKEGDTLCLHGIQYRVESMSGRYYLNNLRGSSNSEIFRVLGIKDKVEFCADIAKVKTYGGDFPEVRTLSDLTTVVKALYERSPYKVGDKVKLKDDVRGCPWVVAAMEKDAGKVVTIDSITLTHFSVNLNGDPHQYRFKEIVYTWSPQTIERKVESAEVVEGPRPCCASSSDDADMSSSMDCSFTEESIIIQTPKPKIKTTIKL